MTFTRHVVVLINGEVYEICNGAWSTVKWFYTLEHSCKTWKMNRQALDAPRQQELIGYLVQVGYTCTVKLYKLTFESNFICLSNHEL